MTQSSASLNSKVGENQAAVGVAVDGASGDKEPGLLQLERITTSFGARPECFKNTLQEVAFVMQATVATASSAFLAGTALIITVPVSLDLNMTQGQISWISASTACVLPPFSYTPLDPILVRCKQLTHTTYTGWSQEHSSLGLANSPTC